MGAGTDTRPGMGASEPGVGGLIAGFLRPMGRITKRQRWSREQRMKSEERLFRPFQGAN